MKGLVILLIGAVAFGGMFWHRALTASCDIPLSYRIGDVDARFHTTPEEIKAAAREAEALWESRVGIDLFVEDQSAQLAINLVFDDRQELANEEEKLRVALDAKSGMSDEIRREYEALLRSYSELTEAYEARVATYEKKLLSYNDEVTSWNERGGAPADVFSRLTETKAALEIEQGDIEKTARELKELARRMNTLSATGNSIIREYNETVESYNARFSEGHEFAQGDYDAGTINIYQFDSTDELVIVIAHELGHALGLGHVGDSAAIMHHLMGEQSREAGVSEADVAEISRVCGDGTVLSRALRIMGL